MKIEPIKDQASYERAMSRIDELMDMNEGAGPKAGSVAGDELEVLATLAEAYEAKAFPLDDPTPLEAIQFVMEQNGYAQADLAQVLHSRSRASELLGGKLKGLSRPMMQRLHDEWHIPADVLIRDMA